jgi:hypothetical protein
MRKVIFFCAAILSLGSLLYFYKLGATNLYGDGIAHLNIARKVVDLDTSSLWTRYIQLGSPWLPLPHLLALPFIWNDHLWRTGLAGSFVSMACYILTTVLIFEMGAILGGACLLGDARKKDLRAGVLAAAIFALNPSILYLQATPMTELPFLAGVAGAVFLLLRWVLDERKENLILAGMAASLMALTRYEAWAILPAGALLVFLLASGGLSDRLRASFLWSLVAGTSVLYWLWHNWAIYGNAIEFYNGAYSPISYYLRYKEKLSWTQFVMGSFGYAVLMGTAGLSVCAGFALCLLGYSSAIKMLLLLREKWRERKPEVRVIAVLLLLAAPFLFTIYSLYTGNTLIYPLSAIALLNVRYGTAAMLALGVFSVVWLRGTQTKVRLLLILFLVLLQYGFLLSDGAEQLAVLQEPFRNVHNTREARALAKLEAYLRENPPAGKILMHSGELAPSISRGGLKFRDILFEGLSIWHSPTDELLSNAQSIVVKEGDPLWQRLKTSNFEQNFELVYSVEPTPRLMVWRRR